VSTAGTILLFLAFAYLYVGTAITVSLGKAFTWRGLWIQLMWLPEMLWIIGSWHARDWLRRHRRRP